MGPRSQFQSKRRTKRATTATIAARTEAVRGNRISAPHIPCRLEPHARHKFRRAACRVCAEILVGAMEDAGKRACDGRAATRRQVQRTSMRDRQGDGSARARLELTSSRSETLSEPFKF